MADADIATRPATGAQAAPAAAGAAPVPAAQAAAAAGGAPPERPIIIKKIIEEGHHGAHGGAWKIALADMMTAMMAFFLLMWLLGATNEDQRKSIAEYFRPSSHSQVRFGELAGSDGLLGGKSVIDPDGFPFSAKQTGLFERLTPQSRGGPGADDGSSKEDANREGPSEDTPTSEGAGDQQRQDEVSFRKLEKDLKEKIAQSRELSGLADQVSVSREADGLRIEIIDKADFSMFSLGTSQLQPKAAQLLGEVAKSIQTLPNKLAVRGHTDSLGFVGDGARNNWQLSAERADATRRLMESQGVAPGRFSRIEGVADTAPRVPANPADPRNRRVSITVLNRS